MVPGIHNLTARPPGVSFSVEQGVVQWDAKPVNLPAADCQAQGRVRHKNPLIREDVYEIDRATQWLEDELCVGPVPSEQIQQRANQVDISYGTLRRAFKILECKVRKQKTQWFWSLPDLPETKYEEEFNERIGVPDGESHSSPQETELNRLEVADAEEVGGELATTNEMVLVS